MFAKSPRIRRNELLSKQGEDSPRSVKSSPRAPYNKALIGAQMKKRRIQGNKKKLLG